MNKYSKTTEEIRRFNRFYTVNMGFLSSYYLDSQYSIAETRILFEIRMHKTCIQSDIVRTLCIDKSYLSRIIRRFYDNGLVKKVRSDDDKRSTKITLTEKGSAEADRLVKITNDKIEKQIKNLAPDECDKLCSALNTVISILDRSEFKKEGD